MKAEEHRMHFSTFSSDSYQIGTAGDPEEQTDARGTQTEETNGNKSTVVIQAIKADTMGERKDLATEDEKSLLCK